MELYGFATQEELNLFQQLISVSGVGPKAALSILSASTRPTLLCLSLPGMRRPSPAPRASARRSPSGSSWS